MIAVGRLKLPAQIYISSIGRPHSIGVSQEVLSSMRTVAAFTGEEKEAVRYEGRLEEAKKTSLQSGFRCAIPRPVHPYGSSKRECCTRGAGQTVLLPERSSRQSLVVVASDAMDGGETVELRSCACRPLAGLPPACAGFAGGLVSDARTFAKLHRGGRGRNDLRTEDCLPELCRSFSDESSA